MTTSAMTPPRTKRRWVIALVVSVVVILALAVAGEFLARAIVPGIIIDKVRSAAKLSPETPVDVTIDGLLLPQLVGGSLNDLTLTADDVTIRSLSAQRVEVEAKDVAFSGEMAGATAHATLTQEQVRALIPKTQIPIENLTLGEGTATAETSVQVFGVNIAITLTVVPAVVDGDLTFTPEKATIGGVEVKAEDLTSRFGDLAADIVKPWPVCLRSSIPSGVTLTEVTLTQGTLIATARVDGAIAVDSTLQQPGTCP